MQTNVSMLIIKLQFLQEDYCIFSLSQFLSNFFFRIFEKHKKFPRNTGKSFSHETLVRVIWFGLGKFYYYETSENKFWEICLLRITA